ncbi:MAG: DUF1648 domain-containing protein, partial [Sediminibacterium sp.]
KLDKILEQVGSILLFVMWSLSLYVFFKSPDIIPTHYNGSGTPDDYGNKATLLILPVVASVIYFGMTVLNKYPHIFNYMTPITADNALIQYTAAAKMLRVLKLVIVFVFTMIVLFTHLTTTGAANGLSIWFLPITFVLLLTPVIILIVNSLKAK